MKIVAIIYGFATHTQIIELGAVSLWMNGKCMEMICRYKVMTLSF